MRIGAFSGRYSAAVAGSVSVPRPAGFCWSYTHWPTSLSSSAPVSVTAASGSSIFCRTWSALSGSRNATRARNTSPTWRLPISTICSVVSAAPSSRAIA